MLRGGASALAAALAGCTGATGRASPPDRTPPGTPAGTDPGPGEDAGGPSTRTATSTPAVTPTGILLPGVDVRGSRGGLVELRRPGTAAVLDFFATWCPPCKPQMEHLRAVRERFDPGAVSIVSVTQETDRAAIKRFWREYRGTWPVTVDPDLRAARKYGATTIPTIVVLAPDGTEVERRVGLVGEAALAAAVGTAIGRGGRS